jgi:hypothetical protein
MADWKKGFTPSRKNDGGANTKALFQVPIQNSYATAIFKGDPVVVSAGYLVKAAGPKVLGVFDGCSYVNATTGQPQEAAYFPANTSSAGILAGGFTTPVGRFTPAQGNSFYALADSSVPTSVYGNLYGVSAGTGSAITGQSGMVIHVSASFAEASVAQAMVRVVGVKNVPGNLVGDAAPILEIVFPNVGYDS